MVGEWGLRIIVLFVIANTTLANISNVTLTDVSNNLDVNAINKMMDERLNSTVKTRRVNKKNLHRSTSSSKSGNNKDEDGSSSKDGESLGVSLSSVASSGSKEVEKYGEPKSTVERHGWRKWHRKCTRCPEEMGKKWRDPTIKWICGAFQRARRSFKSLCMMHYRNCQDGTMFVKIHDHRCKNDTAKDQPHGDHFFYDYKVVLSQDTTKSDQTSSSSLEESTDL